MANGKVELKCDANVVVGATDSNKVTLTLTCKESLPDLYATLLIPCGVKEGAKTFLLDSTAEEIEVNGSRTFAPQNNEGDNKVWKANGFKLDASSPFTLDISGFSAGQGPGEASLTLLLRQKQESLLGAEEGERKFEITLPKDDGAKPQIHYFSANRISKVYSDKTRIEFSSYTTKAKLLKLRNVETKQEWTDPIWKLNQAYSKHDEVSYGSEPFVCNAAHRSTNENCPVSGSNWEKCWKRREVDCAHKFFVPVDSDGTYQLEAWLDEVTEDPKPFTRHAVSNQISVKVLPKGETSYDFEEQGFPLLLLSGDLKGKGKGKKSLYGLFAKKERTVEQEGRTAILWTMAATMGSPDGYWTEVKPLPDEMLEMGESPGLFHGGQLWLIGGSSANPMGPRSNRVCCFRQNENNQLVWETLPNAPFTPRMGHACVVFQNMIWVLGGLDCDNRPLSDVWSCTVSSDEKPDGTLVAPKWNRVTEDARWSPRCLFAAAVKSKSENTRLPNESLWICGGARHPYRDDVAADFWYSENGKDWTDLTSDLTFPGGGELAAALGPPLASTLLYDEKKTQLILVGVFKGTKGVEASRHTLSFDLEDSLQWTRRPSILANEKKWSNPFLIRSVIFEDSEFFLPVYQRLGKTPSDHLLCRYIP